MTVVNETRGKDNRNISTINGLVEEIVKKYTKEELTFYSSFKFGDDWHKGVFLVVKNAKGLAQYLDFPQEFSPPEQNAIVGKEVLYKVTKDLIYKGSNGFLNRFVYELEVLNGTYKDWRIEKIFCFDTKNEQERH